MKLDRNDVLWIVAGTLIAGTFALVAYDQMLTLHFRAWQLYEGTESTNSLAKVLRGPITGWYRPVTLVLAMIAGCTAVLRTLGGRWKLLAILVGGTLVTTVGIEVSQFVGQETTPTSEVDSVAVASLVWAGLLGGLPLVVATVAGIGLRSRAKDTR